MAGVSLSVTDVLIAGGALVVLGSVWRAGARQARATERAARGSARLVSLAGRVAFTAALIVAGQWAVIASGAGRSVLLCVLAVPALFAAYTLTRALTVAAYEFEAPDERRRPGARGRRSGGRR